MNKVHLPHDAFVFVGDGRRECRTKARLFLEFFRGGIQLRAVVPTAFAGQPTLPACHGLGRSHGKRW